MSTVKLDVIAALIPPETLVKVHDNEKSYYYGAISGAPDDVLSLDCDANNGIRSLGDVMLIRVLS